MMSDRTIPNGGKVTVTVAPISGFTTIENNPGTSSGVDDTIGTPSILIIFLAEIYGTALLLFLGCMSVCPPGLGETPAIPNSGPFGFGLVILIAIQSIGHISGAHLNPQVTMAAVILGQLKPVLAPIYFIAEFLGALLGFGLLKILSPETAYLCTTLPHKDLTIVQILVIEAVITGILVIICGAVWDARNSYNSDSVPLRFGFAVVGIIITAGPYTGASMNTARSFAPALLNGNWDYHWLYWVSPTVGAILGSLFYKYVLSYSKK